MWTANIENGDSVNSKMSYWTDLKKSRRITAVQLTHPFFPRLYICLKNYDAYYYVKEAMAYPGQSTPNVLAEIIGAHDQENNIGIELKLTYEGNVQGRTYPLERFSYATSILMPGKKIEKTPSYTYSKKEENGEESVILTGSTELKL